MGVVFPVPCLFNFVFKYLTSLAIFIDIEKNLTWNYERPNRAKTILSKKQNGSYYNPGFQVTSQSYINKNSTVMSQKQTCRSIELKTQRQPQGPVALIFDKDSKITFWREDDLLVSHAGQATVLVNKNKHRCISLPLY